NFVCGGIDLGAAHVIGGVNDLPVQIAFVHYVEIDQAERADTRCRKIIQKRRAESAAAYTENFRCLELLLAFKSDFGQDQVPRVTGNFRVFELWQGHRFFRKSCHVYLWALRPSQSVLLSKLLLYLAVILSNAPKACPP